RLSFGEGAFLWKMHAHGFAFRLSGEVVSNKMPGRPSACLDSSQQQYTDTNAQYGETNGSGFQADCLRKDHGALPPALIGLVGGTRARARARVRARARMEMKYVIVFPKSCARFWTSLPTCGEESAARPY